jgi:hypothetical protein
MRKILFPLAILLMFCGCKPEDMLTPINGGGGGGGTGSLQVSMDGTNTTFNTSAIAALSNTSGFFTLQMLGFNGAAGTSSTLQVAVIRSSAIATGTYSETNTTGDVVSVIYHDVSTSKTYQNFASATNPLTITITALSSTSVQGTFQGDIFDISSLTTKKVLTSGSFNLHF